MYRPRFKGGTPEGFHDIAVSIIGEPTGIPAISPAELLLSQLTDIALGRPAELFGAEVHPYQQGPEGESVEHPKHYRADSGLEAIDAIEAWNLNFNLGNVVKYVCRAGLKDSATATEDLEKALWYLSRELETKRQR